MKANRGKSKNQNVCLREFNLKDLQDVKNLIQKTIDISYSNVYSKEVIQFIKGHYSDERIRKGASEGYTVVLELNGKIIGTGTLVDSNVRRVFVDPSYQFMGFGKRIMKSLEEKALLSGSKTVTLAASRISKRFYDSLGYSLIKKDAFIVENQRVDFFRMKKDIRYEEIRSEDDSKN